MAGTISCDAFTCSYLLSSGLLFVSAMWMSGKGRDHFQAAARAGCVAERDVARQDHRPDGMARFSRPGETIRS
jgi:hypothetical protein